VLESCDRRSETEPSEVRDDTERWSMDVVSWSVRALTERRSMSLSAAAGATASAAAIWAGGGRLDWADDDVEEEVWRGPSEAGLELVGRVSMPW
jgi:hypothetical protein